MSKDPYIIRNEQMASRYNEFVENGAAGYLKANSEIVEYYKIFSKENKHVFFGYYDLPQINEEGTKMLLLVVDKDADPKYDAADVYIIDICTEIYDYLTSTRAWCWQQGCRMRWLPKSNNLIMLNTMDNNIYVSEVWDIELRKKVEEFPYAFYDVSFKRKSALGLDFSRLQTLRPGYGYSSIYDNSTESYASGTGIYRYDFDEGKYNVIVEIDQLAKEVNADENDYHYINHICISPDEDKFMFFHLWAKDGIAMWKMRLMLSDFYGNYSQIDNSEIISHYCWINNNQLLVSKLAEPGEKCFICYDLKSKTKKIIDNDKLIQDGHPTIYEAENRILVDTYPLEDCIQKLFLSNIDGNENYIEILNVFSDPRMYIEHRCDLHPRWHKKNNVIIVDSTFSDGIRKCILIKLRERI